VIDPDTTCLQAADSGGRGADKFDDDNGYEDDGDPTEGFGCGESMGKRGWS